MVLWPPLLPLSMIWAVPAAAHEARPLYLHISELDHEVVTAVLRVPSAVPVYNRPTLHLPQECSHSGSESRAPSATSMRFRCEGGIGGKSITVRYQIANPAITTLIRLTRRDGTEIVHVLPPGQTSWIMPSRLDPVEVAGEYFVLGIRHIWGGIDHLLFIFGLVLLAGSWQKILLTVTGFTIAHSITLALAALELVKVAIAPTEAVIALSVLFLARELVDPRTDTLAKRLPLTVACTFGLLHGFGFAAVLSEVGLPPSQIAIGLLFFNLGVEAGQILFVGGVLGALAAVKRIHGMVVATDNVGIFGRRTQHLCAYGLGIVASAWFIERFAMVLL